jgi:arsenical pump membrane protein
MSITMVCLAIAASIWFAIRPVRMGRLPLNGGTVSLAALAGLVILGIVGTASLKLGVFGSGTLVPWEIIVIFFTTAYISISADRTGLFDFAAHKIVRAAGGQGGQLFVFIYLFSCVLTVFTSNDIVILTLTPIIFYLGKHASINVIPLLFAEYFGANTSSMLLYIGNPTNIIIGNALSLGFLSFTKAMWLPALVATVGNLAALYAYFRTEITRTFTLRDESTFDVSNWPSAIAGFGLLAALLTLLLISERVGWPIWGVTAAVCLACLVKDVIFSPGDRTNGIRETVSRMPWQILPFVFSFFVFIAALNGLGGVDWLAAGLAKASGTLFMAIVSCGIAGIILANLLNNQPMSILFAAVLTSSAFAVPPEAKTGAAYAAIAASNLGANVTLIGALAGLMWSQILRDKGITIEYGRFLRAGLVITTPVFILTLMALYVALA